MAVRTTEYKTTPLSKFITKRTDELAGRKSQKQIAQEAGFNSLQIVSMMRAGDAKLPLDKVTKLARALECDPALLFRLAIANYSSDAPAVMNEIFGTIVTRNEAEIIEFIRELTDQNDPTLTEDLRERLKKAFTYA